MFRVGASAAAMVACFVSMAAPQGALASPAEVSAGFRLEGSNGYRVVIARAGPYLQLVAYRKNAAALYITKIGSPTRNGIEAHLGALGEISVQFKPSERIKHASRRPRGCSRARTRGVFLGTISFQGEQGYTGVDVRRAVGEVTETRGDCDSFDRPMTRLRSRAPQRVGLYAIHKDHHLEVEYRCSEGAGSDLSPIGSHDPDRRYFEAVMGQRVGRISILRIVEASSDDPASFGFDNALTSVTATPPPPFAGSASFARASLHQEKGSWTGSLSASFPGAENVPLAGPGFMATVDFDREVP